MTCPAFPQESSPAMLENEPSLSVSWSTAQSVRLLLLRKKSCVLLLLLVIQHLHLQICFASFSQHSLFSLIADVSASVPQPDTFLHEEPCVLPSFSCPPPTFSYVTNYSDSILISKVYCQYHSGALKTLPEQRCPFV